MPGAMLSGYLSNGNFYEDSLYMLHYVHAEIEIMENVNYVFIYFYARHCFLLFSLDHFKDLFADCPDVFAETVMIFVR